MAKEVAKLQAKIYKTYLKLLKASVKHQTRKMAKLETKLIQLELELKDGSQD